METNQKDLIGIDLDIPDECVLLSSYEKWNVLMDFYLIFKKVPDGKEWGDMFDALEGTHIIQGVVAFIKKEWIRGTFEL